MLDQINKGDTRLIAASKRVLAPAAAAKPTEAQKAKENLATPPESPPIENQEPPAIKKQRELKKPSDQPQALPVDSKKQAMQLQLEEGFKNITKKATETTDEVETSDGFEYIPLVRKPQVEKKQTDKDGVTPPAPPVISPPMEQPEEIITRLKDELSRMEASSSFLEIRKVRTDLFKELQNIKNSASDKLIEVNEELQKLSENASVKNKHNETTTNEGWSPEELKLFNQKTELLSKLVIWNTEAEKVGTELLKTLKTLSQSKRDVKSLKEEIEAVGTDLLNALKYLKSVASTQRSAAEASVAQAVKLQYAALNQKIAALEKDPEVFSKIKKTVKIVTQQGRSGAFLEQIKTFKARTNLKPAEKTKAPKVEKTFAQKALEGRRKI